MVRQLLQVALDVSRGECRAATGKYRVYIIPSQQGSVVAAAHTRLIATLCKHRRHTRQRPLLRITHVEIALGVLEIVYVRRIILSTAGSTGYQLGKLACKRYVRGLLDVQERYLVQHRGEPLRLLFPVDVQAPDGVTQRFLTHIHLRS